MIYEALVRELKGDIWPEGVPENLVAPINNSIEAAITHVQRYVPCLQNRHINRYPQCSTYFQGGKTVLDAPKGRIDKIYTILDEPSEEVYPSVFEQVTKEQLDCESLKHIAMAFPPPNADLAVLPLGKKYPEEDSDYLVDSTGAKLSTLKKHGRAVIGRWAIERDKVYVSPWINSDELVVVEWDGIKTRFSEEDAVCDDSDFKRAVRLFVMREHARDFDSDYERYRYVTVDFHEALGDLIHECLKETQVRKTFFCAEAYDVLAARRNKKYTEAADAETTVAAVAAAVTSYVFGIIGDYGASAGSGDYGGTNASAVATLVKGWSPEFIITTGDNAYASNGSDPTYYPEGSAAFTVVQDADIGQWYSDFIHPYGLAQSSVNGVQQYTSTATENKFFPAIGNHDIVEDYGGQSLTDTGLHWWKSYFSSLPGSKKYYSFTNGPVEFFCLFGNQRTSATTPYDSRIGNTIGSGQYDWLSTEMPNSSAHWKVVYFHNSPFTTESGGHSPGEDEMRWDFAALGADVVISGHAHNYERLKDGNDFPYLVCGASGAPLRASQVSSTNNYNLPDDATAVADLWKNVTTEKFYGTEHGAIRGTVADTELKFEFINKSGTVIETYTITKALSDTTPTRTAS